MLATQVTSQYHFQEDFQIVPRQLDHPSEPSELVRSPLDNVKEAALFAGFQVAYVTGGVGSVRPTPPIDQVVDVSFIAVALPYCARVRLQVVPAPSRYSVSSVIAIVTLFADLFMKIITVQTGNATFAFESMVNVRALASEAGCRIHFPLSVRIVV